MMFLLGAVFYVTLAFLSYSNFKYSTYGWVVAAVSGAAANIIWFSIARNTSDPTKLAVLGIYWDVMLTSIYLIVALWFFDARFTLSQTIGIILIVIGIILIK